jgi:AraC-like DNA-binding protein
MQHAVRAEYLIELLRFMPHVQPAELLGADVTEQELTDPERLVDGPAFFRIVERAATLSGDPSFGRSLGRSLGTTKHGFLGYLARSCKTLREKFQYDAEFLPTRVSTLSLSLHEVGDAARIEVRTAVSLGSCWPIIADLVLGTMARLWEEILPEGDFTAARDSLVVETQEMSMSITMPRALLDVPLRHADGRLKELAAEQCARALSEHPKRVSTAQATASLLAESLDHTTTLESVAKRLALSPRTFRRKLAADGTSFQKLLDEVRAARARHYLHATELTIDEIASKLAFQQVSSFCQAFKRWTGMSPGQFRAGAEPVEPI